MVAIVANSGAIGSLKWSFSQALKYIGRKSSRLRLDMRLLSKMDVSDGAFSSIFGFAKRKVSMTCLTKNVLPVPQGASMKIE